MDALLDDGLLDSLLCVWMDGWLDLNRWMGRVREGRKGREEGKINRWTEGWKERCLIDHLMSASSSDIEILLHTYTVPQYTLTWL